MREAVGDDMEIAFDVHTRLDLPDTLWLCNELEPCLLFFVEDPLRCENTHSYRTLRQRTSAPLAAGEQFISKWEFRQLIEEDLIDYARIDVCIVGGLTEARKIAGWCETHYIKLATHNPLGPFSTAACLHLNMASPLVGVQEQARKPGTQLPDVFPEQVEWKDGWLLPPERSGLGVTLDREAARANPMRERRHRQLQKPDGSVANRWPPGCGVQPGRACWPCKQENIARAWPGPGLFAPFRCSQCCFRLDLWTHCELSHAGGANWSRA